MKQWYVVHTLPRGEELACQNLKNQGFQSFLPKCHRVRRHARKTDVVISPLFPRYLFVSLDLETDRWHAVDSTRGVAYLLRLNGTPTAVLNGIVEELQSRADIQETVPLSSLELFQKGTKLEILEGAFSGYTGSFEKLTDGERVQLLLSFLGKEVKMQLPIHSVVAVA